jgi:hypothetical protein
VNNHERVGLLDFDIVTEQIDKAYIIAWCENG